MKQSESELKTPVLFLVFNRPDLTRRVFARIREARPTRLFVAADGPREDQPGEARACEKTRRLVQDVDWPCEVKTLFRDRNLGCREAVGSAITWFFEHVEAGIILEDDCLPDPSFFPFCTEMLERYRDDERVMSISGSCFQPDGFDPGASYYFSAYQYIWGWATWRRAWRHYDLALESRPGLFDSSWLSRHLDNDRAVQYWSRMIDLCRQQRIKTWDYPWLLCCWHQQGLALVPTRNLVANIGFDARATHTRDPHSADANRPVRPLSFPLLHPAAVQRHVEADHTYERAHLCPEPGHVPAREARSAWKLVRRGLGIPFALGRLAGRHVARFRAWATPAQHETRRLRALGRFQPTETTLEGRTIQILDAPTYLSGRREILEREIYKFTAATERPRIIDCGANIGLSVIYFKRRYPGSRILAFEADPRIAGVLAHNLRVFGFNDVEVRPAAVWVDEGELEFCVEGGLSGRLPKGDGDAAERTRVPACRLRDVLAREPVDLLKIDIEGAEMDVLRDCREFIRKDWISHLYVEYHSHVAEPQSLHDLLALLAAGGYRYHILPAFSRKHPFVDRSCLVGMDLQVNVYAC